MNNREKILNFEGEIARVHMDFVIKSKPSEEILASKSLSSFLETEYVDLKTRELLNEQDNNMGFGNPEFYCTLIIPILIEIFIEIVIPYCKERRTNDEKSNDVIRMGIEKKKDEYVTYIQLKTHNRREAERLFVILTQAISNLEIGSK